MTANELLLEIASLGFCSELSANAGFISALNRSLKRIFGERRVMCEHTFFAYERKPVTYRSHISHKGGAEETVSVRGGVFSVYAHGSGYITVLDDDGERIYGFDGTRVRIFGKIRGGGTVKLGGSSPYYLTDLVTYKEPCSDGEIHDGSPTVKYCASKMVPDLLSIVGTPTDGLGRPLSEIGVVSDTLFVPADYTGRISFLYLKNPRTFTGADLDEEIGAPEDCKEALALLVASYLLLDTDPKLASHYGELYREAMARAPKPRGITYGIGYRDTSGWA